MLRRKGVCLASLALVLLGCFLWTSMEGGGSTTSVLDVTPVPEIHYVPRVQARETKINLAVCVRLHNEASYLAEWLEFHLLAGVEFFYIFDDSSTDSTHQILAPYVKAGLARVWPVTDHSHDAEHGQFGHRDQCIRENTAGARWIAMIDGDEFLFPTEGLNVSHHLSTACSANLSYLMLRWHM